MPEGFHSNRLQDIANLLNAITNRSQTTWRLRSKVATVFKRGIAGRTGVLPTIRIDSVRIFRTGGQRGTPALLSAHGNYGADGSREHPWATIA